MMKEYKITPRLGFEIIQIREGKIMKSINSPCHSYTRWFVRRLACATLYIPELNFRPKIKTEEGYLLANARPTEIETWVIAIGASNQPFSFDDYKLYDKRMEISRAGFTITYPTDEGNTCYWEVQGRFNIETEFDIWETGLFAFELMEDGYDRHWLIARDVLPSPFHVVPGDIVYVKYKCTVG
jgi:hypothetical protein